MWLTSSLGKLSKTPADYGPEALIKTLIHLPRHAGVIMLPPTRIVRTLTEATALPKRHVPALRLFF
jgi:hypothetical protein